jgi:hypothetical protein
MTRDDLLAAAAAIRAPAAAAGLSLAALPIAAIGWATVDHERAMAELDEALGGAAGATGADDEPWRPLPRDGAMGARAQVRGLGAGMPALVVLEPDTEGRLAASLARFGEGVAVVYLGTLAAGGIGGARLVRGGPAWGPHVVVLGDSYGSGEAPA